MLIYTDQSPGGYPFVTLREQGGKFASGENKTTDFTTLYLAIVGKKSSRKVAKTQRKETNKLKNLAFFAALREKLG